MFAESTLYSKESAQVVADRIAYFALHRPDNFCEIPLVSYSNQAEEQRGSVFIKADSKTTIADDTEVVHCHNREGTLVDIILGRPKERELHIAQVIIGTRR